MIAEVLFVTDSQTDRGIGRLRIFGSVRGFAGESL